MRGVTINDRDEQGVLKFDLKDILRLAGERALRSRWKLTDVEALGEDAADEIHRISDRHSLVDGRKLMKLADGVSQIVDGQFEAYDDDTNKPWLVINAVDSSAYDVQSDNEDLLTGLRAHFESICDLPESSEAT